VINATIVAQQSRTRCVIGSNVTFTQTGIEVSGGCRAYFLVTALTDRPAYSLRCASGRFDFGACVAPEAQAQGKNLHAVWLGDQKGDSLCGGTAGFQFQGNTIFASPGCNGVFNYSVE